MKKTKFADKATKILKSGDQTPKSVSDFLSDGESKSSNDKDLSVSKKKSTKTQSCKSVNTHLHKKDAPKVREDFQFPSELSERLREYAFKNRTTKTAVVIEALAAFFQAAGRKKG